MGETREYGVATDLVGLPATTLRVRILRREGDNVWVVTADLQDAGTRLVLNASQVTPEEPGDSNGMVWSQ